MIDRTPVSYCPVPKRWGLSRVMTHLLCAAAVLANIPVGILAYWYFLDSDPVLEKLEVMASRVAPDARSLELDLDVIKRRDCHGEIHGVLERVPGDIVYTVPLPILPAYLPTGEHRLTAVRHLPFIPSGEWRYVSHIEYWCNPLQWIWPVRYKYPPVTITMPCKSQPGEQ